MAIVEELYTEIIKSNYRNYYEENYEDYEGDLDDFKEEVINELYNSDNCEPFNEIYSHLIFFLKVVKENDEDYGGCFKEWDNPQKVYELGMYFLASNVIRDMTDEDIGISYQDYQDYRQAADSSSEEEEVQEEEVQEDNLTRAQ